MDVFGLWTKAELPLWAYPVRSVVVFLVLLILTRIMGKQEVGRLAPLAVVVAITIGSIAADPLVSGDAPVMGALVSMTVMSALWMLFTYLALRSNRFKDLVGSHPIVVIENGRINSGGLRRIHFTVSNLMSRLRLCGVFDPADVEFAIVEPTGNLSVILKSQQAPARPVDIGLAVPNREPARPVIIGGRILSDQLAELGRDELWLIRELARHSIYNAESVLLATVGPGGALHVSRR